MSATGERIGRGIRHLVGLATSLSRERIELPNRVLVGTHHKTGTVWMIRVFQQACRDSRLRFAHGDGSGCGEACDVYVSYDSRCPWQDGGRPWKGLHVIRDPRDVVVSAAHYHAVSAERWLHVKTPAFGGLSYAEKIGSFTRFEDRVAFEMEHDSRRTIDAIANWNYRDDRFHEVRYETLIEDRDLRRFHEIFTFLGFPGSAIPSCLRAAHDNSLFSGRVSDSRHVRSGQARQWRRHLTRPLRERFRRLFGDALIRLGYEPDDTWVDVPCEADRIGD